MSVLRFNLPSMRGAPLWCVRAVIALLVMVGSLSGARSAEPAKTQPFASKERVLSFISHYREEPVADLLPAFVKAAAGHGVLDDSERAGIYFGFVAGVLADNQTKALELVEDMFPLRPEHQVIVIRGLAYSGLPEWQAMLGDVAERMPARKVLISDYLTGKAKTLDKASFADGPHILDAWWGFYFATGSYYPAQKIIGALAWAGDENDLEKLTVGSMAKWTLATNASRDKHLLDFLRSEQAHQPAAIAGHLREVVVAAETYTVGKLRRKTLASIEKLKKNGPAKWNKWAWWGRAGQMAMTVGCVAASAMGQIEFGLPCVIGGAASTGLLNLLQLGKTMPQ